MDSLVAYGSSCSSSDTDDDTDFKDRSSEFVKPTLKLPTPALGEQQGVHHSVFSNPFVEAELAKAAILEKHVKMAMTVKVPGKDQILTINGKKICWSYRKGRCRFGHNCKYAHDTDIQKTSEELEADKKKTKVIVCEESGTNSIAPPPVILDAKDLTNDETGDGGVKRKLKRPGLSQGLVPGKKVLKMYQNQKTKDEKK